jgi:hypothetical protein
MVEQKLRLTWENPLPIRQMDALLRGVGEDHFTFATSVRPNTGC